MPVLPSTAFLTVLLAIGLFFFIRASTKDRIEVTRLVTDESEEKLLQNIQSYFSDRAYRIATVNADENQVVFEGFVRPSVFLALFLTLLAAVGLLCLALVLSFSVPSGASVTPGLVLFAPLAGLFYWKKAGRSEQVALQFSSLQRDQIVKRLVTVTAHRDELATLKQTLQLEALE